MKYEVIDACDMKYSATHNKKGVPTTQRRSPKLFLRGSDECGSVKTEE